MDLYVQPAEVSAEAAVEAGVDALLDLPDIDLPKNLLGWSRCSTEGCGKVKDFYCQTCADLFKQCREHVWHMQWHACSAGGFSKGVCGEALGRRWSLVSEKLWSCRQPFTLTLPCPTDRWGARMSADGVFHSIDETTHLGQQGISSLLLQSQLVSVNNVRMSTLKSVTVGSHGPSANITVLLPSRTVAPEITQVQQEVSIPAEVTQAQQEVSIPAAAAQACDEWLSQRRERILHAAEVRRSLEEPYHDIADRLFATLQLTFSDRHERIPKHVYRSIALQCAGDEDACVRKLYAWADRADRMEVAAQDEDCDADSGDEGGAAKGGCNGDEGDGFNLDVLD